MRTSVYRSEIARKKNHYLKQVHSKKVKFIIEYPKFFFEYEFSFNFSFCNIESSMKKLCFDKYRLSKDQFLLPLIQKLLRFCSKYLWYFYLRNLWRHSTYWVVKLKALNKCFKGIKVTPVKTTDSITHIEDLVTSVIQKLCFCCVLEASSLYFAKLECEKCHFTSPLGQGRKIMVVCKWRTQSIIRQFF